MNRIESQTDLLTQEAASSKPPDLSHLVGFSRADLFQNRAEQLSDDQAAMLRGRMHGDVLGVVCMVGMAALGLFLFGPNLVTVCWIVCLAVFAIGRVGGCVQELRAGVVSYVEGDAQDTHNDGDYFLYVGDVSLSITGDIYGKIPAGGPYRFYYVPRSKRLVGGEALPGWKAAPSPPKRPRPWWIPSIEIGNG